MSELFLRVEEANDTFSPFQDVVFTTESPAGDPTERVREVGPPRAVIDNNMSLYDYGVKLTRSNDLIRGRYKSTLLEQNIMAFSIMRSVKDDCNRACASFTTAELKEMIGRHDGSFYSSLKKTATALKGRIYCIEERDYSDPQNPRKNSFILKGLVDYAEYKNGKFVIKFSPEMNVYIDDLKSNFTTIDVRILTKFTSIYAYRLYEILKSEAFHIKKDNVPYRKRYNLSELKLLLCCVDTQETAVQHALNCSNPDFDDIVANIAQKKHYNQWYELKRNVLDVGVRQINEYSDLLVDFEAESHGRGAKVGHVVFSIQRKQDLNGISDGSAPQKDDIRKVKEALAGHAGAERFTEENIKSFLKYSGNDIEKIKDAMKIATEYNGHISNLVGFIITSLKNGNYQDTEDIPMSHGSVERGEKIRSLLNEEPEVRAKKAWMNVKGKVDFNDFLHEVDWSGLPCIADDQELVSMLEELYDFPSLLSSYWEWRKAREQAV